MIYLTNKTLMAEVQESKRIGKMTPGLAQCFYLLVTRMGSRYNFRGYSFREDMEADALLQLCDKWHRFDPEKSSNPFAFYTQISWNKFVHYIKLEKKHRDIRDKLLLSSGQKCSLSFEMAAEQEWENNLRDNAERG